jgi:hypothetical protein
MSYWVFRGLLTFFRPVEVAERPVTSEAKLIVLHSLRKILFAIRTFMMIGLVAKFIALEHIRGYLCAVLALNVIDQFTLWSQFFSGISE